MRDDVVVLLRLFMAPIYRILQFLAVAGLVFAAGSSAASDSAAGASGTARKTLVVLGDSLAAGYGLDRSEAFPALLQAKIDEARLKFQVVNASVSGDTSAGGLRRLDWQLKRPIDVLVIELGGNDGLRGLAPSAL